MSASELQELVDSYGWVETDAGMFPVRVVDARQVYGRVDLKVRPADHKPRAGHPWVQAQRFHEDASVAR